MKSMKPFVLRHPFEVIIKGEFQSRFTNLEAAATSAIQKEGGLVAYKVDGIVHDIYDNVRCREIASASEAYLRRTV